MSIAEITACFPGLQPHDYVKTSEATDKYNCVAWSFDDDTKWWQPPFAPWHYWPEGFSKSLSVDSFVELFVKLGGYEPCADGMLEEGFEKVVFYADEDGDFSHVAKQKANGMWASKLGELDDIEHSSPRVLEADYGKIAKFIKRPRK